MDYTQKGDKVRKLRIEKSLTQETFAEALGISVPYVGLIKQIHFVGFQARKRPSK